MLVRTPAGLTVDWAQQIVDSRTTGVIVSAVDALSIDVGTTTRVSLAVEHDGELPRRWFVKLPSAHWRARAITALPRLPQTEVRFYNEVAGGLPVACPVALAATSRIGRGFTLLLADVTEGGGVVGRPDDLLDAERVGAVIDLLARLHASMWEDRAALERLSWLDGPVRRIEDGLGAALAEPLMKRGLDRAGDAVPGTLHAPALDYAGRRRSAMRHLAAGPRTMVHHDCHPGNLFWIDTTPGLLDWQMVRIGEGVGDVAYLLALALDPNTRRCTENDLLRRYRHGLLAAGVAAPELEQLRARYRAHLTYAFEAMIVTLAVGGLMDDDVAIRLVRRAATAVADLEAFAAFE